MQTVRLRPPVPKPSLFPGGQANFREGKTPGTYEVRPIFFFLNAPAAIIGPGDTVELPEMPARVFHHEAELAFVIKKKTTRVKRDDAMESVFGYTTCIDVSARGLGSHSFRHQSVSAKSFDTFKPIGPALVTADEIPDPHDLDVKLWVNGEPRQDYNTSDMEHRIPEIIEYISSIVTLNPGDIIACGTNHQGLGAMQDGDGVDIEIERIGRMSVNVVDPLKRTWPRGIDKEMAARVRQGPRNR